MTFVDGKGVTVWLADYAWIAKHVKEKQKHGKPISIGGDVF